MNEKSISRGGEVSPLPTPHKLEQTSRNIEPTHAKGRGRVSDTAPLKWNTPRHGTGHRMLKRLLWAIPVGEPAGTILQADCLPAGGIPKIKDATCNFSSSKEGIRTILRVRMRLQTSMASEVRHDSPALRPFTTTISSSLKAAGPPKDCMRRQEYDDLRG